MDNKILQVVYKEKTGNPLKAVEEDIKHTKQRICETDDRILRELYVNELEYFYDRKYRILRGLPVESKRIVRYIIKDGKLLPYQE
jgi:hypothetical protein